MESNQISKKIIQIFIEIKIMEYQSDNKKMDQSVYMD
jgi:hypothetical protein